MRLAQAHSGVQDLLPLDDIVDGVLCLRGGEYRAVIEAQSVNFALKSEEEQEAVMAGYRTFLNSLSHPVQILVRILPTDVEPYLEGFRTAARQGTGNEALRKLALDHDAFVRRLARERTLLERRFYLVVPADDSSESLSAAIRWPWRNADSQQVTQKLEVAAALLTARCQELIQGLVSFGVPARRLESDELAELWAACLSTQNLPRSPSVSGAARPVVATRREAGSHG